MVTKAQSTSLLVDAIEFDAGRLAGGWLSVALAASNDKDRAPYFRTVCVEFFPKGVRLVATDTYMLLWSWVPKLHLETEAAPALTAKPSQIVVARDTGARARSLMGTALARLAPENAAPLTMTLTVGPKVLDPEKAPLAFEGVEQRALVIDLVDEERLILGLYDGAWPEWVGLVKGHKTEAVAKVGLNPSLLAWLGQVEKFYPGGLALDFSGPLGGIAVKVIGGDPQLEGLLMPMRIEL